MEQYQYLYTTKSTYVSDCQCCVIQSLCSILLLLLPLLLLLLLLLFVQLASFYSSFGCIPANFCMLGALPVRKPKESQVKLPLIKPSDNRTSFTNAMNENKIVKRSIYNKILSQYKMSQIGRRSSKSRSITVLFVSVVFNSLCIMIQAFYQMADTIRIQRLNTAAAKMAQRQDQSSCRHLHHSTCTSLVMPAKR